MCWDLTTAKNIASICASLGVFMGALVAGVGAYLSLETYRNNGKLKRIEMIHGLYDYFLGDKYEFYELIKSNEPFSLTKYDKTLNECMTYFDELEYYFSRKLLDKKSLEYFASEILNFRNNSVVEQYLLASRTRYVELHWPHNILPFSGFDDLVKNVIRRYKIKQMMPAKSDRVRQANAATSGTEQSAP